jgi:hypothetical protein
MCQSVNPALAAVAYGATPLPSLNQLLPAQRYSCQL